MKRRYDLDWIRVIAIGLLLIYHSAIGFQPWGNVIGFITNDSSLESLWIPMSMLNVWRIPILFYVSGMGLFIALQNKSWKQLILERSKRILTPLIFGIFTLVPIKSFLFQNWYHLTISYLPNTGHLWFLGNIMMYIFMMAPFMLIVNINRGDKVVGWIKNILINPIMLCVVIVLCAVEVTVLKPASFDMYAHTTHGFFLGLLAFVFGYLFMAGGEPFWQMLLKWKWPFLSIAIALFIFRCMGLSGSLKDYFIVIESNAWVFSLLAFSYQYLNKGSKQLTYLLEASYPIYIIHMIFLFLGSSLLFSVNVSVGFKFILLFLFTVVLSFVFYEFIIRRFRLIRVTFGLK